MSTEFRVHQINPYTGECVSSRTVAAKFPMDAAERAAETDRRPATQHQRTGRCADRHQGVRCPAHVPDNGARGRDAAGPGRNKDLTSRSGSDRHRKPGRARLTQRRSASRLCIAASAMLRAQRASTLCHPPEGAQADQAAPTATTASHDLSPSAQPCHSTHFAERHVSLLAVDAMSGVSHRRPLCASPGR